MKFTPATRSISNMARDVSADFFGLVQPDLYKISGRVTSAIGTAGIRIMLAGSKTASTKIDAAGNYTFGNLPGGGNYSATPVGERINFKPANRSFRNLSQDQSADFFGFVSLDVHRINGRVTDEWGPLAGVKIALEGSRLTSTTTDTNGNYIFSDLRADGSYTITPKTQRKFKPPSRSFSNLAHDASADFLGLGPRDQTSTTTTTPDCSETEKEGIGAKLVANFREAWRRNIERERSRIIAETVKMDVKNTVANLGPIEFQPMVTKCSAVLVTARYSWQVKADLPQGLKVVDVPKVKRFACARVLGAWVCN
jgi:hypothetical protein